MRILVTNWVMELEISYLSVLNSNMVFKPFPRHGTIHATLMLSPSHVFFSTATIIYPPKKQTYVLLNITHACPITILTNTLLSASRVS